MHLAKSLTLAFLLLLSSLFVSAHAAAEKPKTSPLDDAVALATAISEKKDDTALAIISNYDPAIKTREQAAKEPFLGKAFGGRRVERALGAFGPSLLSDIINDAVRGLVVAETLKALGEYLEAHPSIKAVVPRTSDYLLKELKKDNTDLSLTLQTVRAKLKLDAQDLPSGLLPFVDSLDTVDPTKDAIHPRVYLYHLGAASAEPLRSRAKFRTVLDAIAKAGADYGGADLLERTARRTDKVRTIDAVVQLSAFLSHVFRNADDSGFVKRDEIASAFKKLSDGNVPAAIFVYSYLGLGCLEDKKERHHFDHLLVDSLDLEKELELSGTLETLDSARDLIGSLQAAYAEITSQGSEGAATRARQLGKLVEQLLKNNQLVAEFFRGQPRYDEFVAEISASLRTCGQFADVYTAIENRDYGVAITTFAAALETWAPPAATEEDIKRAAQDLAFKQELDARLHVRESLIFFAKYRYVLATIVSGSDADLKNVIEDLARQASHPERKFNQAFTLSFDIYAGALFSRSHLSGNLAGTTAPKTASNLALTAPVGFAANWRMKTSSAENRKFSLRAISAFVPLVDVGALTSWRLKGGSGTAPDNSWSNVYAPGAYLMFAFQTPLKNLPLCLGFGSQYGPRLQKVSTTAGNTVTRSSWQAPSVTLSLNLYSFPLK